MTKTETGPDGTVSPKPTVYYAPIYDTLDDFPFKATAWYWQVGNRWMAVIRDWEPEKDWFKDTEADGVEIPTPRTYPINQLPPSGILLYADATGEQHEQVI